MSEGAAHLFTSLCCCAELERLKERRLRAEAEALRAEMQRTPEQIEAARLLAEAEARRAEVEARRAEAQRLLVVEERLLAEAQLRLVRANQLPETRECMVWNGHPCVIVIDARSLRPPLCSCRGYRCWRK